ncbi:MAG TPA: CGNR zinc finger domain-containing protein [Niallia sp.]|nr:CGNR zinc finger domain-containing protein [Niallia sp.]
MQEINKFPLISGNMSLDLVNTEVVRWGQRHDLFINNEDILDWISVAKENNPFLDERVFVEMKEHMKQVTSNLIEMRKVLRKEFETIADQHHISNDFITFLEEKIKKAPFTYKIIENKLIPHPVGEIEDVILSLIAYDTLTLIAENKLTAIKRCSNPECVLLFIDTSGRRKWCSMKICGNRKKVAKFQHRKIEDD